MSAGTLHINMWSSPRNISTALMYAFRQRADTTVVDEPLYAHYLATTGRLHPGTQEVLAAQENDGALTSLQRQLPDATLDDTGLVELVEILDALVAAGQEPIVVDSKTLLTDPQRVLGELCVRLGLVFDAAMLSWPPGPKPEDGVWAQHWYDAVHRSTGFERWHKKDATLAPHLEAVLEQSLPLYARLQAWGID